MFLYLILIVFIVVIIAAMANPPKKDALGNEIKTSPSGIQTVDLDVPDPTKVSPERFLDFIDETPGDYLWQVRSQLQVFGKLKHYVLSDAIEEKAIGRAFDKKKYQKILQKIQSGSFPEENISIPEDYKFVCTIKLAGGFIADRKKYIIFDLDEGAELTMKPEPYNKHDKNAIAFLHGYKLIGYVPAVDCRAIRDEIRFQHKAFVTDIVYQDDYIDVYINLYRSDEEHPSPEYYLNHETLVELKARKIRSELLKPKKDADDINAFYKKKVVITGEFDKFPDRNVLAEYLYQSGADVDTCITERTDYAIIGKNAGWKKLDRIKELGIMTFDEKQISKLYEQDKEELFL